MTVQTTKSWKVHTGNGSSTAFPYDFKAEKIADLALYPLDAEGAPGARLTLGTDYSATVGASGGTVTYTTAPASGAKILVRRESSKLQEATYPNDGDFDGPSHERQLDRAAMSVQEVTDEVGRAIKLAYGETPLPPMLRALFEGGLPYLDDDGDWKSVAAASLSTITENADAIVEAIEQGVMALKANRAETKIIVSTGEALKTVRTALLEDGQLFETRDRIVDGLGGGATYAWRAGSEETADDANFIEHEAADGVFEIMRPVGRVDVREFKALLDGSDDSGAFAAAFATGKHIFVPPFQNNIVIGTGTPLPGLKSGQTIITEDGPAFHTAILLHQPIRQGELNEKAQEGGIGPGFRLIAQGDVPTIEQTNGRAFRVAEGTWLVNCHTAIALGNKDADEASYYFTMEGDINMRAPYLTVGAVTDGPFEVGEKVTQGQASGIILSISGAQLTLWQTNDKNFTVGETVIGQTSGASAPIVSEYRPGHMLHVLNHAGNLKYDCNGEGAYDGLSDGLHIDSNKHVRFDECHIDKYLGRNRNNIRAKNARPANLHVRADLEGALEYCAYFGTDNTTAKSNGEIGWGGIYFNDVKMSVLKPGGAAIGIFPGVSGPEYQDIIGRIRLSDEHRAHGLHLIRSAGTVDGVKLDIHGTINPTETGVCGALIDAGGPNLLRGLYADVDVTNETAIPLLAGAKVIGQPLGHIPRPRVTGLVTNVYDTDSVPLQGFDVRSTKTGLPTDQLVLSPVFSATGLAAGAGTKTLFIEGGIESWYPEIDYLCVGIQSAWSTPPPANCGDLAVEQNSVLVKGHSQLGTARHNVDYWQQKTTFLMKANQPVKVYFSANGNYTGSGRGMRAQFQLIPYPG